MRKKTMMIKKKTINEGRLTEVEMVQFFNIFLFFKY